MRTNVGIFTATFSQYDQIFPKNAAQLQGGAFDSTALLAPWSNLKNDSCAGRCFPGLRRRVTNLPPTPFHIRKEIPTVFLWRKFSEHASGWPGFFRGIDLHRIVILDREHDSGESNDTLKLQLPTKQHRYWIFGSCHVCIGAVAESRFHSIHPREIPASANARKS
jgi:hypothetical protein